MDATLSLYFIKIKIILLKRQFVKKYTNYLIVNVKINLYIKSNCRLWKNHIIETIYQIIFNFYFLIIHTWIIVYLYTWNKYCTIKTKSKSILKRNLSNLWVSNRFTVRTSGGRSGSRANSRPWHVSHALRYFRRVPTPLLSRMRACCVSRDAQGLSLCLSMDAIRSAWDWKFSCRWYLTFFFSKSS